MAVVRISRSSSGVNEGPYHFPQRFRNFSSCVQSYSHLRSIHHCNFPNRGSSGIRSSTRPSSNETAVRSTWSCHRQCPKRSPKYPGSVTPKRRHCDPFGSTSNHIFRRYFFRKWMESKFSDTSHQRFLLLELREFTRFTLFIGVFIPATLVHLQHRGEEFSVRPAFVTCIQQRAAVRNFTIS